MNSAKAYSAASGTAPLLCAGITTYSPMRRNGVGKGKKVGVVGLGGLGHMAVKFAHSIDFILDAVSADHDINAYLNLLALDGNLTIVGAPPKPLGVSAFSLIFGNRSFSGSNIGGIPQTQEMLDFCAAHNITADVEVIPMQKVNEAYERLVKSDVKYRFSIDMASLKSE
jgi:uncharacterized zinc-type alcohol dehydrogenase-like protein